jgi:hypothetical protein
LFISFLLLATVFGSLATGTISFLSTPDFKTYWAILSIFSTILGLWAAIMSYSEREFEYQSLSSRFLELALRIESFSGYSAMLNEISAQEIDNKASTFYGEYADILNHTRPYFSIYSDEHEQGITQRLNDRLRSEGKL